LTITLPLALPSVLAGTMLGFARAIGEFGPRSSSRAASRAPPGHWLSRSIRSRKPAGTRTLPSWSACRR
jgi:ABC-type phosphate transport system permease subunit